MKIINLQIENFKKIVAVDITPDENTVILTGKNGQGKSSILDAIFIALKGKNKETIKPIRDGQKKATIEVDLGDYIVKRIFTDKGGRLEVIGTNGAKFTSPQTLLDKLIGDLTFDPLEFTKQPVKKQRELLIDLCGINLQEEDDKYDELYEKRKQVGIEGKALAQYSDEQVKEAKQYQDKEEINITELNNKYNDELGHRRNYEYCLNEIKVNNSRIEELKKEIERLENDNKNLKEIKDTEENLEELQEKIKNADEENKKIRNSKQILENNQKVLDKRKEYEDFTEKIKEVLNTKKQLLEAAEMPIDGLEITDDGVLFNKIPLSQISSGEKLKVAMSIALELQKDKKLKILYIRDGSLLDDDNLKFIKEKCKESDTQVWIEKCDSSGEVGVYIEEGEIKKVN